VPRPEGLTDIATIPQIATIPSQENNRVAIAPSTEELSLTLEPAKIFGSSDADIFIAEREANFDGINDAIATGDGNDEIDSSTLPQSGNNQIEAQGGDDRLFVGRNDLVYGGSGDDEFDASESRGSNRLLGEDGNDLFILGSGDLVLGGAGDDRFFVGEGGDNLLTGGSGNDRFWIANGNIPARLNAIADFTPGEDVLGIAGATSLAIASVNDLTQQVTEAGLLLSSFNDPLVLLEKVTSPLANDSFFFSENIII
jgi:glycerophosphoryl diester phosphodiesterase